uniref:Uncharacterized protein n=1 Tax=Meloidogyne enterolobii TaxID=390850 RepID=A0A6V7XP96_MELEN|nr:unnamed protein product [Meloidogyne enterolobii]
MIAYVVQSETGCLFQHVVDAFVFDFAHLSDKEECLFQRFVVVVDESVHMFD